jgi:hypothetical protein
MVRGAAGEREGDGTMPRPTTIHGINAAEMAMARTTRAAEMTTWPIREVVEGLAKMLQQKV